MDIQHTETGIDGLAPSNATELATVVADEYGSSGMTLITADSPLDLSNFLARPVTIFVGDLATDRHLVPYDDFLNNDIIADKLRNYRYISGTLVVRVTISCARTSYGLARFAIWPGYEQDLSTQAEDWNIYKVSMLPGMWMDLPQKGPSIFRIPFTNVVPAIDLLSGEGASFVQAILKRYVAVDSFTGVDDACQARVEAWMEDTVLTQTIPGIGDPQGEFSQGLVSRPATAIADAAGALVPILGPFAIATQIGAKAVGAIAALFGFSRPQLIEAPCYSLSVGPYIPGRFVGAKFACDLKQELALGTGLCGEDMMDPLSVKKIASHLTLYDIFQWDTSSPANSILYGVPVTPGLCIADLSDPGTQKSIYQTPMAEVAHCFQYWRGTIRFVIKVICHPSYHGGVIRLFWSPERIAVPSVHDVTNTVVSGILDLSTGNEVVLDIPFQSARAMLRTSIEFGALMTDSSQYYNGFFYAQVINPLRSNQISGSPVPIQVHVSVCSPDLEVCRYWTAYTEQMHPVPLPSTDTTVVCRTLDTINPAPVLSYSSYYRAKGTFEGEELGSKLMKDDDVMKLYMGERVESLRTPLKEPMNVYTIDSPGGGVSQLLACHIFPWIERGYTKSGGGTASFPTYSNLYTYLHRSYMGWRGGGRWFADISGNAGKMNTSPNGVFAVWSECIVDDFLYTKTTTAYAGGTAQYIRNWQSPKYTTQANACCEFPLRSQYLFRPSSRYHDTTLKYCSQGFLLSCLVQSISAPLNLSWAASEDFNPVLYLGPQTKWMYYNSAQLCPSTGANRPAPA